MKNTPVYSKGDRCRGQKTVNTKTGGLDSVPELMLLCVECKSAFTLRSTRKCSFTTFHTLKTVQKIECGTIDTPPLQ